MAYKSILIYLNDERRVQGLLTAVDGLVGGDNNAHLIGLTVLPPIIIVPGIDGSVGVELDEHREKYRAQVERMRMLFNQHVSRQPTLSHEWRSLDCESSNPFGTVADVAVKQARTVDICVASQDDPDWQLSGYLDLAEPLILETGRPVLLVPNREPKSKGFGRRVILAWDGSKQAARAAYDALPLLVRAEHVAVVTVSGPNSKPDIDILASLARHGVRCEAVHRRSAHGVGFELLAAADALGADLLVMGCYGHMRLREFIFGGASRHVLQQAHLHVFMSH